MTLEVIGYILYSGLGVLILAFLFLLSSLVNKPKKAVNNLYDEAANEYESYYEEDIEEYVPEKKSFFSFKSKKNKKEYEDYYEEEIDDAYEDDVYEKDEDMYEDYDDMFRDDNKKTKYEYEEEKEFKASNPEDFKYEDDGIEDEYASDFEFLETITKKGKTNIKDFDDVDDEFAIDEDFYEEKNEDKVNFVEEESNNFNIDEEYTDFEVEPEPKEKKKKGLIIKKYEEELEDEEEYNAEEAMLKRFKAYTDSIKK